MIFDLNTSFIFKFLPLHKLRPYVHENTRSRPIAEVKHETVQSVLRWETTREYWML